MAGIDSLVRGTVGSFAKDKVSSYLSPTQMDFARFAMNPQMYLAEKGINAVAQLLGYGSTVKDLQQDAKDYKEYYKEVMRDSIGDMLPDTVGDFIRATPRISEADQTPAGIYTAFDPETQTYIQQGSSNPVISSNSAGFDNFVRDLNYGTQTPGQGTYVGPLPEDNPMFQNRAENLAYDLNSIPTSGMPENLDIENLRNSIGPGGDFMPRGSNLSSTEMIDVLNSTSNFGSGMNVPVTETQSMPDYSRAYSALGGAESVANLRNEFLDMGLDENAIGSLFSNYYAPEIGDINFSSNDFGGMDFGGGGGGGDRGDFDYSAYAMARGGQIPRGIR